MKFILIYNRCHWSVANKALIKMLSIFIMLSVIGCMMHSNVIWWNGRCCSGSWFQHLSPQCDCYKIERVNEKGLACLHFSLRYGNTELIDDLKIASVNPLAFASRLSVDANPSTMRPTKFWSNPLRKKIVVGLKTCKFISVVTGEIESPHRYDENVSDWTWNVRFMNNFAPSYPRLVVWLVAYVWFHLQRQ